MMPSRNDFFGSSKSSTLVLILGLLFRLDFDDEEDEGMFLDLMAVNACEVVAVVEAEA